MNKVHKPITTQSIKVKIRNYNFVCCFVWVRNLVSIIEQHRRRVYENRVLRRIFGPKRDEVTGEWRRLHNEELNDLCSSPNIIRVIKSIRMGWEWDVDLWGEDRCTGCWW
jgi:hypothetical protein